jgi:hypothetical protein
VEPATTPSDEIDLRQRAAGLALAWQEERAPFAGAARDEYPPMIEAAHVVADEARLALHRWVDASRRAGLSWTEICTLVGISTQAAQQRFGSGRADDIENPDHIVRQGANAFNGMAILAEDGANRRELVGTGMLRLIFVQTDHAWKYCRTVGIGPDTEAMAAHGWQLVSSWLPFHYFQRPMR